MYKQVFPRELINNNENILNLLLRSRETDITNKLEMKESEVMGLQNDLKSARDKIRNLQTDIKELSDGRHQRSEATDREGMEERLTELRVKLQQTQLDLDCKDKVLRDATERLEFSDSRLGKMEEFLNSQQLRIVSLENTVQETEKEKRSLLDQLHQTRREREESVQEVITELKSQQAQDNRRLGKVSLENFEIERPGSFFRRRKQMKS